MESWGLRSAHLGPKPHIHCRVVKVTAISSGIRSAIKRKLQELRADGHEKHPDYIMVMEIEKSQHDKGPPVRRSNLIGFSMFPDVRHADQWAGIMSEKRSWCD